MASSNIYKAIAEFQQEVPVILKETEGYGYQYADLPKILEVVTPLLKKHGLGFTQILTNISGLYEDKLTALETVIFHVESGEEIRGSVPIPVVEMKGMNKFQSMGSGITYFRRYALSSMLGLVTDKDTDGAEKPSKVIDDELDI